MSSSLRRLISSAVRNTCQTVRRDSAALSSASSFANVVVQSWRLQRLSSCVAVSWQPSTSCRIGQGIIKGDSLPLTSCLTGLDQPVLQIKTKIVSSHTADSKPVKQEVNGTVILPRLVFPGSGHEL
jgi:hypothetical protein